MSVIGHRIRQARIAANLTQERLGVMAGIDEMSASARMNQYERGVHTPNYLMTERFADVLGVPVEYLYTKDDLTAELLLGFHRLNQGNKIKVMDFIERLAKVRE